MSVISVCNTECFVLIPLLSSCRVPKPAAPVQQTLYVQVKNMFNPAE